MNERQPCLGEAAQYKTEDEPGDEQRSGGDQAGKNVALQVAQRMGEDGSHAVLLDVRITEVGHIRR